MNEQKGLLTYLSEALDRYRATRRRTVQEPASPKCPDWLRWLGRQMVPNIGTLLMVVVLLLTVPSLAAPLRAPALTSDSTTTISYQGRLADSGGNPVNSAGIGMQFRLYNADTGGSPLWNETHAAVPVEDGLFHVLLGSTHPIPVSLLANNSTLWLGITVGSDSEMRPLEQIASVPYAMIASTVPDQSITTEKIADGAVTQAKLGADVSLEPPDGSITTQKLADGAVTSRKLRPSISSGTQTSVWYSDLETEIANNSVTLDVPSNVFIIWSSRRLNVPSGGVTFLRLKRDGTTIASAEPDTGGYNVMTLAWLDTSLPAGNYTYQLTAQGPAGSGGDIRSANLIVLPFASQ